MTWGRGERRKRKQAVPGVFAFTFVLFVLFVLFVVNAFDSKHLICANLRNLWIVFFGLPGNLESMPDPGQFPGIALDADDVEAARPVLPR